MRTINQILEDDKPYFINASFSTICPPDMDNWRWDNKLMQKEFIRFIKSICMIINDKTKYDAMFFMVYSNNKTINNNINLFKGLKRLFPHVRLLCCTNVKESNLILIPRYEDDNKKIELVTRINLL